MFCTKCGAPITEDQKFCGKCGATVDASPVLRATPPPLPSASAGARVGLDTADVYASIARRFAASFIDGVVCIVVVALLNLVTGTGEESGGFSLFALILGWLYKALLESSARQATLGKMALGIKVCDLDGRRIGFGRATGRYFGTWLSALILYVGFIMAAFTARRQALHDILAGTLVVRAAADEDAVRTATKPQGSGGALAVVVVAFAGIVLVGILSAIALPAYQDYAIRAQVTEGLLASTSAKDAINQALTARREPSTLDAGSLGIVIPEGLRYVESIDVNGGAIIVTFASSASPKLAGRRFAQVPTVSANGEIRWICGRVLAQPGYTAVMPSYRSVTNVDAKYLPSACRG